MLEFILFLLFGLLCGAIGSALTLPFRVWAFLRDRE